jgi:hypothetical protein
MWCYLVVEPFIELLRLDHLNWILERENDEIDVLMDAYWILR